MPFPSSVTLMVHISVVATSSKYIFSFFPYNVGENTVSTLGRFVLLIWLFVVLIINSSYTASLTSILTVQQLSSPIKGIESLVNSKEPIGYLQGSFSRSYLIDEIGIHESRLVPMKTPEETMKALEKGHQNGGIAAYVDERAYIELFLSSRCDFSIVGQEFTRNGWGFVSISVHRLLIVFSVLGLRNFFWNQSMLFFLKKVYMHFSLEILIDAAIHFFFRPFHQTRH